MKAALRTLLTFTLSFLAGALSHAFFAPVTCFWCHTKLGLAFELTEPERQSIVTAHMRTCEKNPYRHGSYDPERARRVSLADTLDGDGPIDWPALRRDAEARGWKGGPHCDELVIHRPGACDACDAYPDLQAERETSGINYTGEANHSKWADPAVARRARLGESAAQTIAAIEKWPNNRPYKSEGAAHG